MPGNRQCIRGALHRLQPPLLPTGLFPGWSDLTALCGSERTHACAGLCHGRPGGCGLGPCRQGITHANLFNSPIGWYFTGCMYPVSWDTLWMCLIGSGSTRDTAHLDPFLDQLGKLFYPERSRRRHDRYTDGQDEIRTWLALPSIKD